MSSEFGVKNEDKFGFEDLKVYQRALEYVDFVYTVTKNFPKTETFSLIDQFRRASISVCLNIAEGSGGSKSEFNQFLKIARRSVRECIAVTEISYRQKFLSTGDKSRSRLFCLEMSRMLNGLMKSLKKKDL
jgi:four helix bundle protein